MMDTGALVTKRSTAMRLNAGTKSATRFTVNLKGILGLLNIPMTKDTSTTETDMKVLNDHNGEINGDVTLSYLDCVQLETALFYLMREEKHPEFLANANKMRKQFRAMIAAFDEDFDPSDFS